MRKRSSRLALFVFVAAVACDDTYPLAPTPCDDYCLALQRGNCAEDWPHECVRTCEWNRSPTTYPDCADPFAALVECLEHAGDDDFTCVFDRSTPYVDTCGFETKRLDFCVAPVFYRCLELCDSRASRCLGFDISGCLGTCRSAEPRCEDSAVRWLECELSAERACEAQPECAALQAEFFSCQAGSGESR